ncbi:hypothetical protein E2C01_041056 [Portunus trituberculatus]|uniref:Uncharacterized protein n=1 Tax=Portunus trituberculatus TaxID=210409 RepID=A0A5B7FSH1_PORTR|nr:hypothetical protein [Portunus trituberculatus]
MRQTSPDYRWAGGGPSTMSTRFVFSYNASPPSRAVLRLSAGVAKVQSRVAPRQVVGLNMEMGWAFAFPQATQTPPSVLAPRLLTPFPTLVLPESSVVLPWCCVDHGVLVCGSASANVAQRKTNDEKCTGQRVKDKATSRSACEDKLRFVTEQCFIPRRFEAASDAVRRPPDTLPSSQAPDTQCLPSRRALHLTIQPSMAMSPLNVGSPSEALKRKSPDDTEGVVLSLRKNHVTSPPSLTPSSNTQVFSVIDGQIMQDDVCDDVCDDVVEDVADDPDDEVSQL